MEPVDSLQLFKSLIKDGLTWQGDIFSNKWSECLYAGPEVRRDGVKSTLEGYSEGTQYKVEGDIEKDTHFCVWIA